MSTEKLICDFSTQNCLDWYSVDDVVMGGVSGSLFRRNTDGTGTFEGFLSMENSGGFASVRTFLPDRDYSDYSGIRLCVKGDGKRYSFRIRNDDRFDGIVYKSDFDTISGEWMEVSLPFSQFKAAFRGRTVDGTHPLDASNIVQIGVLVSKKQVGSFILDIDWIKAYRESV
ncbi:MAG: CIA30 family protein [Chlorobium sp.]|jgi:NADH dehydrogenase [ubiquinone] 1 alpha subcomplex assembly factor 1|uniref:CIA30 family protein n=1 Tax=Chlorobium sp. TaxID=1095 RepID=UPI0025B937C7|nr:CIA30 family protein [Chlorobium sp.]MCF8216841.1 CIA30 family protein [Chlorobium sp.]MCF8271686.1 CIA30 family protein [Chlorobium sp.]MCF8288058.1 CIA30 family protein [Chlorobium sp.]MCF8291642.1 CIA30 family protein [Chlorobium sp.]MCF8385757.1 CIA30 family protein [Chlorobium sp.]